MTRIACCFNTCMIAAIICCIHCLFPTFPPACTLSALPDVSSHSILASYKSLSNKRYLDMESIHHDYIFMFSKFVGPLQLDLLCQHIQLLIECDDRDISMILKLYYVSYCIHSIFNHANNHCIVN